MKKIISLVLAILMLISALPTSVFAATISNPSITINAADAIPGETLKVSVSLKNNPGIVSAKFSVSFDDKLTLISATNGDALSTLTYIPPKQLSNGGSITSSCQFAWQGFDIANENIKDGIVLTLTFKVSETAKIGDTCSVVVTSESGDVIDKELNTFVLSAQKNITIIDYTPGDVNDDGKVNMLDTVMLSRYIVDNCETDPQGYNITLNKKAANVNDDGRINMLDVVLISRYIVDGCKTVPEPDGYNVTLVPESKLCEHSLSKTNAKEATCTEDGNIEYWKCSKCNKYFSDSNAAVAISLSDTVKTAKGHVRVEIPPVEPTYDSYGSTAGVKCSTCGTVLVSPAPINPLESNETYVEFKYAEGDSYLEEYILEQTENGSELFPKNKVYNTTEKAYYLPSFDLEDVPGYEFEGWFVNIAGVRQQIMQIEKGQTGTIKVYAKFTAREFEVTYASDMVPITNSQDEKFKSYKTNVGHEKLPTPKMDKYIFVGWSDKDGNLWNSIPKGTVGNLTLYANWASHRNKAEAVKSLKDPLIVEDSNNGLILFTYEIGQINKVPLFTLMNLNCANGIVTGNVRTEEISFGKDYAESAVEAISNATTNSTAWTLEENWNSSTEVSQKTLDETGYSQTDAQKLSQSQTGTFNVGTSFGGSNTYTNSSTGAFKLSGNQSHSETNTIEKGQEFGLSVDGKYSSETSGGVSLGIPLKGLDLGINAGKKNSWEIGAGADYKNYVKNTHSGTDSWSNSVEISGENTKTKTNEKNWNTDIGFSSSQTTSIDKEVSKTISKLVSQEYGYGETYAEGGSKSNSQAQETSNAKSNEFSSTLTYHTSEIKSNTTSYTSTGNTVGDYRLLMTGTVHVFAVVGYDVATSSYFVYTYNVFDENSTEEYLDYSYDGSFNDYETSIIPFEIPVFVNDYVNNRVAKTDGMARFNYSTGEYEAYTGDSKIVSVPSYHIRDNGDGTKNSYKVNGIKSGVFQENKNIVGVVLGHHITEIPDNAFKGCTSLKYVIAPGVTKIGKNAFSGCENLSSFNVPYLDTEWQCANAECKSITKNVDRPEKCAKCSHNVMQQLDNTITIGEDAFLGAPSIIAKAASVETAQAVAASGAQDIVLNISYIPKTKSDNLALEVGKIDTFELRGEADTYRGFTLKSDAKNTIINRVNVTAGKGTALNLSSENVTLNGVDMRINATACAMMLKAPHTNVFLKDTIYLSSNNDKPLICKEVAFEPLSAEDIAKITVEGDVLVCDSKEDVIGKENLECNSIVEITADDFAKYERGVIEVSFDANGGNVSQSSKEAYYGDIIGELPTPTRDYYTFDGWYTKADGGEQYVANTILNSTDNIVLYAHWTLNATSGWVKASSLPAGAQVVSRSYSYTERTYKESKNTSESGWTQYDKYWVESGGRGSANYASFPGGFDTGNWIYTSFNKSAYSSYENTTNKRVVSNSWAGYVYWHWMYDCGGAGAGNRIIHNKSGYGSKNNFNYKYFGAFLSSTSYTAVSGAHNGSGDMAYTDTGRTSYADSQGSKYWFRFDYYTSSYVDYYRMFKYYKDTRYEYKATCPSGSNISNVVEYVQYRAK